MRPLSFGIRSCRYGIVGVCVLFFLLLTGCGSEDPSADSDANIHGENDVEIGPDAGPADDVESIPDAGPTDDVETVPDAAPADDVETEPDADPDPVDDVETDTGPESENACGGTEELDAEPGEPCEDGAGQWGCDGENEVVCEIEENACGGTEELDVEPGEPCEDGAGYWVCDGDDELVCDIDANACGGTAELDGEPGESCEEGAGEWVCDGDDAVVCEVGENACGGTAELDGEPGESCEGGAGEWVCDGDDAVVCEVDENACGGTAELDGEPGESCEEGAGEWVCIAENQVVCEIEENACGGTEELDGEPGESCEDGSGEWVCDGDNAVVCDIETNACGGTEELDHEPGESCNDDAGQWVCDGDDTVTCAEDESNACGGTEELDGEPGTECGDCGSWECDGADAVTCTGTVDLQTDDEHCGQCDEACSSEQTCNAGQCEEVSTFACEVDDEFYGQIGTGDEIDNAGGTPTTGPFTHHSGLGDIIAEVEDVLDGYSSDEISNQVIDIEFDETIEIDGATVTAVEYRSDTNYWLGDADAGVYFRAHEDNPVDAEPSVGDRVSFDVDGVEIFHGTLQLNDYSDWTIIDNDTPVSFIELDDQQLDTDEHYGRIVRMAGELTDTSWSCAGDTCFVMNYGPNGEYETTFKTRSSFVYPGDCITYIGPIKSHPRFYVDGAEAQVDAGDGPNFGWDWHSVD